MILNLLLCVTALGAAGPQQTPAAADDVLKREQQRIELLVAGKLDELAAMLSPTLTYIHSSAALDTKDTFLDGLRSGRLVYKGLKHRDVQVRFATPDVAILTGLSDVDVITGGQPQQVPLRFTIVYVRRNGTWMMEAWHSARRPV